MPSEILKKALNGDEVALIETTFKLQHGKMHADDIEAIKKAADKDNQTPVELYLIAALLIFGEGNDSDDILLAIKMLRELISKEDASYARNLLSGLPTLMMERKIEYQALREEAARRQLNPLAILNACLNNDMDPTHWQHEKTEFSQLSTELTGQFKLLTLAYSLLSQTSYKAMMEQKIEQFREDLLEVQSTLSYGSGVKDPTASFMSYHTMKDPNSPLKNFMPKAWFILATYYENTHNRVLMMYCLSQATKLNNKYEKIWVSKLEAEHYTFKQIKSYLESFLQIDKVLEKNIQTAAPDELRNVLFRQDVALRNCMVIARANIGKLSVAQAREISRLADACVALHATVTDKITKLTEEREKTIKPHL